MTGGKQGQGASMGGGCVEGGGEAEGEHGGGSLGKGQTEMGCVWSGNGSGGTRSFRREGREG